MPNSAIDLLDGVINNTHKIHNYINKDFYNKLLEIKSIVDHIQNRLISIAFETHKKLGEARKKDGFYLTINESIIKYGELAKSGASLDVFVSKMVTPLLKIVFDQYSNNLYADEIGMLCKKARTKLCDFHKGVTDSLNDFKKVKGKVKVSIDILKIIIEKIKIVL